MAAELHERVALVIGAGSPLGEAAAKALAAAGSRVAVCDWSPDAAERVANGLGEAGGHAMAVAADASKKLALQSAIQAVLERWERIDVLVNASAVQPLAALLDMDEWDWHRALDLNLGAAFMATQSVGRVMRELGGGLIVFLVDASVKAIDSPAYMAAAGGVRALCEAVQRELANAEIVVELLEIEGGADEVGKRLTNLTSGLE